MRHIGDLADDGQARTFADFMVAKGIRNQVDRDAPGSWSVWVMEEDQVAAAQSWLERFRTNPQASEFRTVAAGAAAVREAEEQELTEYRQRIRTAESLFPSTRTYGPGLLTCGLVLLCVVVAIFSQLGADKEFLRHLYVTDPGNPSHNFLPEIFSGQVWRLVTPMLIHFSAMHLIFNMMMLFQFGSLIEGRQNTWVLVGLVLGVEAATVIAQYFASGWNFGGMSGVIYGLGGYIWIRGHFNRASGLYLDSRSVTILLVWLVLCYTGLMGLNVANTSHLVGLLLGMGWGGLTAYLALRRP